MSAVPDDQTKITDLLTEGPFIRAYVPRANADQLIHNYLTPVKPGFPAPSKPICGRCCQGRSACAARSLRLPSFDRLSELKCRG
jgi:hypothetical protein